MVPLDDDDDDDDLVDDDASVRPLLLMAALRSRASWSMALTRAIPNFSQAIRYGVVVLVMVVVVLAIIVFLVVAVVMVVVDLVVKVAMVVVVVVDGGVVRLCSSRGGDDPRLRVYFRHLRLWKLVSSTPLWWRFRLTSYW